MLQNNGDPIKGFYSADKFIKYKPPAISGMIPIIKRYYFTVLVIAIRQLRKELWVMILLAYLANQDYYNISTTICVLRLDISSLTYLSS